MLEKAKSWVKEHLKDIATLKRSSHSIASGFALGTFIAILPTFGFGIIIGLFIVLLFKKISKLALFSSFIIWNPITLFFVYPINYIIGNAILSDSPTHTYEFGLLNRFFEYSGRFLIGSFVLAFIVAVASYFIIFLLIEGYKKRRALKMEKKNRG